MTRLLISLLLVLSLASCSNVEVGHYADQKPALDLERFFSKPVKAWGIFEKRSGEVAKRFEVDIASHREGDKLILDEKFLYSDGTRQRRVWTLTPDGPGAGAGERVMWWARPSAKSPGTRCGGATASTSRWMARCTR